MDLVHTALVAATFGEVTDPVGGSGGAGVDNEKDLHEGEIIRHCPNRRDGVYLIGMGKGSILIVEDNMDNYELVRFVLERAGYDVFLAVNGRDGVDAARFQKPDLILLDMGMPEMDGWDAAQKLKADEVTQSILLYALTAYTLPEDRKRALQAGCDGYVSKPIHVQSFLQLIDEAFEKINKRSE